MARLVFRGLTQSQRKNVFHLSLPARYPSLHCRSEVVVWPKVLETLSVHTRGIPADRPTIANITFERHIGSKHEHTQKTHRRHTEDKHKHRHTHVLRIRQSLVGRFVPVMLHVQVPQPLLLHLCRHMVSKGVVERTHFPFVLSSRVCRTPVVARVASRASSVRVSE